MSEEIRITLYVISKPFISSNKYGIVCLTIIKRKMPKYYKNIIKRVITTF